MMLNKISLKLCRLCSKEKHQGTNLFKDKIKGSVLLSIINKYFSKEVINILPSDKFSKFVCNDCEQKIYLFDEFCLTVANVQKQLTAPTLEINFAEDMLRRLKENEMIDDKISLPTYNDRKRKSICDVCSKSFRCQAHLERHKRIHTGVRPFVCDICNMSFNQREILTKHKERHEGKKEYQCANCQQSFRYKVSLQSHLVTFHADLDKNSSSINCNSVSDTSPTCTDCGKIFATNYKLRRHARYHSGEKPYSCPYCSRNFSQTGNLKLHQLKCHQINLEISSINNGVNGNQQSHINVDVDVDNRLIQEQQHQLNNFQSMVYITESEIQKTINETINSTTDQGASYLNKSFQSPMYIDEEIETMLDQDLEELDNVKYSNSDQEKVSRCLKQPETPELLHSLLYDG